MVSRSRAPRRRWNIEFKKRVVAEASQASVSGADIVRKYDLNASLLFNWKKKFGSAVELVPAEVMVSISTRSRTRRRGLRANGPGKKIG